jgi:phosphoribosylformimino-5-aminoimidazole carboxamide ribonucleotide (ProFAR) isomerase
MGGPDLAGLSEVLRSTPLPVIASGGVGALGDLLALDDLEVDGRRLAGAIVGTAIYEGRLSVVDAVRSLAGNPT